MNPCEELEMRSCSRLRCPRLARCAFPERIANAAPCERRVDLRRSRATSGILHVEGGFVQQSRRHGAQREWPTLTLSERNVAEECFLFARLRAPVLRRGFDRRTELRRCVPRPTRVVQQRAGKRDQIG